MEALLVVFADGSAEGSTAARVAFLETRALEGAELAFWASALEEIGPVSPEAAKRLIRQRLQQREESPEGKAADGAFAQGIRGDVRSLLSTAADAFHLALARRASRFGEQARGHLR
jgi:hypothetical protein